VRVSERLRDSPACLVRGEGELSGALRRVLAANGQALPPATPVLELNVTHPLVQHLDGLSDPESFGEFALLLYDQASLADEGQVPNGPEFSRRLNKLLVRLVAPAR
jgi:molecular chaperone HtpG